MGEYEKIYNNGGKKGKRPSSREGGATQGHASSQSDSDLDDDASLQIQSLRADLEQARNALREESESSLERINELRTERDEAL